MTKKSRKATGIMKLLKQGYSPREVTQRMAVSYNYAWKLKKDLEDMVGTIKPKSKPKPEPEVEKNEAIARVTANRHEVPEHQQHLITEHEWDGCHDRVWCKHGIDQLGEMCEVCYPETVAKPGEFTQADTNVDAILNTRATTYGSFADVARMAQRLKSVAHTAAGEQGKTFAADQAEALDMIFSKLARILNGDPNYVDSWTDIAGYATLVADRLQGKAR